MSEDYEWDKSGQPSEEFRELESVMAQLRYDEPLAATVRKNSHATRWLAYAAAAVVIVGIGASLWVNRDAPTVADLGCGVATEGEAWSVKTLRGKPRCGNQAMAAMAVLPIGSAVETDPESSAEILVADIGRVVLEPNSRVALQVSNSAQHRMQLEYGIMHAQIDAPPRLFLVQTPAALAVDLGCAYTLEVIPDDRTHLHVTHGYVSLEKDDEAIYVPAGYRSDSFLDVGTSIPYASDAPEELVRAVHALVHGPQSKGVLEALLQASTQPQDTLGLWHLVSRDRSCEAAVQRIGEITGLMPQGPGWSCSDPARSAKWKTVLEPLWNTSG